MYTYACKVRRVVDGDTIDIEADLGFDVRLNVRVRLIGINAPECYGRFYSAEGRAARDWVDSWVGERLYRGRWVFVSKKYHATEKYGRALGFLQWISPGETIEVLNDAVVAAGHATKEEGGE